MAFVETKNLEGETSMKHKYALKDLQSCIESEVHAALFRAHIECEGPNRSLVPIRGSVACKAPRKYALDHNNLLLRGTSLKNTEWIYGVVVYTGHDSKIMHNSGKTRTKFSKVEVQTNKQIILIFLFQCAISVLCSVLCVWWTEFIGGSHYYLQLSSEDYGTIQTGWDGTSLLFMIRFGTWMLLFG